MGKKESMKINNNEYYLVKGVRGLFQSEEQKGVAKINLFEFKRTDDFMFNFRAAREHPVFVIRDGEYVQLFVKGQLMMSDTGMERISNKAFIKKATGHVLIAGLGIGLIIYNILDKQSVQSITIVEKYQDIIDLISPKFTDPRIKYICADIFEWKPDKGSKYDTIYFDIWPEICVDNLKQITILHNRFKSSKNKNGWMNSWMKEYLQKQKRNRY